MISRPFTTLRAGIGRCRWFELLGAVTLLAGFAFLGLGWWQRSWPLIAVSLACGVVAAALLSVRINPGQARYPRERDEIVWVGKRGHRFHRQGCRLLGNSAHELTLFEARESGLEGCEICGSSR